MTRPPRNDTPVTFDQKDPCMTTSTADSIRTMGTATVRLADALAHAHEVQHLRPAGPSTRQDSPEKAQGGISRPTEDLALDPRRLRLRAAVISGELAAEKVAAYADREATELTEALAAWAGTRY